MFVHFHYKFTGKERDTESGLDNFTARFYASTMGRFMSADDSKYVVAADPQTWNLYGYVANNPLNAVDPTGHGPNGYCNSCHMLLADNDFGPSGDDDGGSPATSDEFTGDARNCLLCELEVEGVQELWAMQAAMAAQQAAQIPANVKEEMQTSVNDSNSPDTKRGGDDATGGYHEEGGDWVDDKGRVAVVRWKPGKKADPGLEGGAQIVPDPSVRAPGYEGNWHVHPRGTALDHHNNVRGFGQPPSDGPGEDLDRAKSLGGINIVIGARDKQVYFYNGVTVIGQISLKNFMK
jgi:RHS repeat-associated protein